MKITVLTPTYNRAHTLPNLYNSLIKNKESFKSFEWLIMDDGSIDETEKLVNSWIAEKRIDIKYFKQQNQGKMAALNNLLEHISGEITVECDSDDYFTDTCFKNIVEKWPLIENDEKVYGMAFLRVTKDNKTIGTTYMQNGQVAKIFDAYFRDGITGDKCLIFKSNIRKQFKHKLENNEKFSTEGRMYHEMDLKYKGLKWFNIPGIVCEYLDDGYTKNIINFFKKAPFGHYYYYLEMFRFNMKGIPFKKRLHIIKHYILFSCLTKKKRYEVIKNSKGLLNKMLAALLVIPGYIKTRYRFR